jgi:hypothetical protein
MGRGRAKAKQTKVARELKYNSSPDWDPSRLENELRANGHAPAGDTNDDDEYAEEDDSSPPQRR